MLLNALKMWNYNDSSSDLFVHIVQAHYCKSNHLVSWTVAILEHESLNGFLPERRSAWAEDLFVLGHEMVITYLNHYFRITLLRSFARKFTVNCAGGGLAQHMERVRSATLRQSQSCYPTNWYSAIVQSNVRGRNI
jgi:hypothetical protein